MLHSQHKFFSKAKFEQPHWSSSWGKEATHSSKMFGNLFGVMSPNRWTKSFFWTWILKFWRAQIFSHTASFFHLNLQSSLSSFCNMIWALWNDSIQKNIFVYLIGDLTNVLLQFDCLVWLWDLQVSFCLGNHVCKPRLNISNLNPSLVSFLLYRLMIQVCIYLEV